jgi:hypothetical protein
MPYGDRFENRWQGSAGTGKEGLVVVAVLLLAAFFMPLMVPKDVSVAHEDGEIKVKVKEWGAEFPNITALTDDDRDLEGSAVFLLSYPLIAGVILIIAAFVAPPLIASAIAVALGLLVYLVLLLSEGARGLPWLDILSTRGVWVQLMMGLGLSGVLAGCIAKRQRPGSKVISIVGIVGGAMLVGAMLLPVLPGYAGRLILGIPFKMFSKADGTLEHMMALLLIGGFLAWLASGILSIVNIPSRREDSAGMIADRTFQVFMGGVGLLLFASLLSIFEADGAGFVFAGFLGIIKVWLFIAGFFAMIPLGAAGLMVAIEDGGLGSVFQARANAGAKRPARVRVATSRAPAPPGAASRAPAAQEQMSPEMALLQLQRLYEQGRITAEQYEQQRRQIMG